MQAIERLVSEHDLIERVLTLLEKAVARVEASEPLPPGFARWAPGFFAQFADQCHHAKEEDVLFPLLKQKGIPEQGGPIGVMLHEHVLGRECVGRMRAAGEADPVQAEVFAEAARRYIPLLRQHIFKENNILFRMAERVMNADDDRRLVEQYDTVERERDLTGWHAGYAQEVADWEQLYA